MQNAFLDELQAVLRKYNKGIRSIAFIDEGLIKSDLKIIDMEPEVQEVPVPAETPVEVVEAEKVEETEAE